MTKHNSIKAFIQPEQITHPAFIRLLQALKQLDIEVKGGHILDYLSSTGSFRWSNSCCKFRIYSHETANIEAVIGVINTDSEHTLNITKKTRYIDIQSWVKSQG